MNYNKVFYSYKLPLKKELVGNYSKNNNSKCNNIEK